MSVPTQKTMGTAWMEMASMGVHTPELLSSSPMAIPSNRLCTESAITTRKLRREDSSRFSARASASEVADEESVSELARLRGVTLRINQWQGSIETVHQ